LCTEKNKKVLVVNNRKNISNFTTIITMDNLQIRPLQNHQEWEKGRAGRKKGKA